MIDTDLRTVRAAIGRHQSRRARGGAVTFIQRFGDALNLNVHFHTLLLDGVYERYGEPGMRFRPLPPPEDDELQSVVEHVARRIGRLLARRGLGPDADPAEADPLGFEQPLLAGLTAASVRGQTPGGGHPARRGDRIDPDVLSQGGARHCAAAMGFTLHAAVAVPARDRRRLERLCRYAARPPVATERLERLPDGRLLYRLRHRWRDGTTRLVFEPQQLLARLVPLIPAPGAHQVRYHGVLAPCAGWRGLVVPSEPPSIQTAPHAACRTNTDVGTSAPMEGEDGDSRPERTTAARATAAGEGRPLRRYPWADLLRRVFEIDVLECLDCGGPMRVLAVIHPPAATRAILGCLGLPSCAPPVAPARPEPEPPELLDSTR